MFVRLTLLGVILGKVYFRVVDSNRLIAYMSWGVIEWNWSLLPNILSRSWSTNVQSMVHFPLKFGRLGMLSDFVVWLAIGSAGYCNLNEAASLI